MKRISIAALLLAFISVFSVLPVWADYSDYDRIETSEAVSADRAETSGSSTDSGFDSGDGTQSDPFIIKTEEQLEKAVSGYYLHSWFKLGADIKIKKDNWKTEGTFVGILDGDGHVISGLKSNYGGLFDHLFGATVKNLGLINVDISVKSNNVYVGALARGANDSEIINCYVSGNIKVEGNCIAAAFVGRGSGVEFRDCINKATVEAEISAGFVATAEESHAERCVNLGLIKGETEALPFIRGGHNQQTTNCYYYQESIEIGGEACGIIAAGLTRITSDSMKNQETFKDFDFENVWKISESGISLTIEKDVSEETEEKDDNEAKSKKSKNGNWIMLAVILGGSLVVVIVVVVIISVAVSKKKKSKKISEESSAQSGIFGQPELFIQPITVVQPEPEVAEDAGETVAQHQIEIGEETEQVVPKFCTKCGSPVVEGANFCNSCGNKLG